MSLETINKRLQIIANLQQEISKRKAIYEENLEEDPLYQEVQAEVERVKQDVKERRIKVLAKDENKALSDEIKDLRDDLKDNRETLAQELADYYKETGSLEFTDNEGNTKVIKFSVKLKESK